MEDNMADLHAHFKGLSVQPHMFASQWFLTMFAAKVTPCHLYTCRCSFLRIPTLPFNTANLRATRSYHSPMGAIAPLGLHNAVFSSPCPWSIE